MGHVLSQIGLEISPHGLTSERRSAESGESPGPLQQVLFSDCGGLDRDFHRRHLYGAHAGRCFRFDERCPPRLDATLGHRRFIRGFIRGFISGFICGFIRGFVRLFVRVSPETLPDGFLHFILPVSGWLPPVGGASPRRGIQHAAEKQKEQQEGKDAEYDTLPLLHVNLFFLFSIIVG